MEVADLTPQQLTILSDPEAYHSMLMPPDQPTLSYFQSPFMLAVAYGMEGSSRSSDASPNYGLSSPILSPATTRLYPGLWPEIEEKGSFSVFKKYRGQFQRSLGNAEFWERVRSKESKNDPQREECTVLLSTLYLACWVLPLRRADDDTTWTPELFWLKIPAGKNSFSRGGTAPKAKPLWNALTENRKWVTFPLLFNPQDLVVFSWKKVQNTTPGADKKQATSYEGGKFEALSSEDVQAHLKREGLTSEVVKTAVAEVCLPYIARHPMSSTLKISTLEQELEALNEYLINKKQVASLVGGQLVVKDKRAQRATPPVDRIPQSPPPEWDEQAPSSTDKEIPSGISLASIKETSAGALLLQLLTAFGDTSDYSDTALGVVMDVVTSITSEEDKAQILSILEGDDLPSRVDDTFPDIASIIKATLVSIAEDNNGFVPLA